MTTTPVDRHQKDAGTRGAPRAARLAFDRVGSGDPLVLLHGQGVSRRSWDPIVPALAAHRDVVNVDLPGHGESPRQPKGAGNTPHDQAVAVAELLDELGLATVDVAGNSAGGWVALELARLGRVRTVTALSPAGLWRRRAPLHIRLGMRQARLNARITRRLFPQAPRSRAGRALASMQVAGHPFRMPYQPIHEAVHDMAAAPGFRETLRALEKTRFEDGGEITVPVTVAFGTRDRVLLPGYARRRRELSDQTRWVRLRRCGHIPWLDDPGAVVDLVLRASDPTTAPQVGKPIRRRLTRLRAASAAGGRSGR